jgi:hypothetical protein
MVKIIDKRTESKPTYKIGDWVYYTGGFDPTLCVLTQTESGVVQLIVIDDTQANRVNDVKGNIFEANGSHNRLSDATIHKLTNNGKAKLEKVNVTIEVTNYNS